MEKGHKRVRDHIADIREAQAKVRQAQANLQGVEMELVRTLIDKHDPYLLKPNYTVLSHIIRNDPEF